MLGAFAFAEAPFAEEAEGPVSPQGVSATGSVGSVTVTGIANVSVTGLGATASVGDISIISVNSVFVTGLEATASVGDAIGSIPITFLVDTSFRVKGATIPNDTGAPLFGGQTEAQAAISALGNQAQELGFELGVTESPEGLEATSAVGEVSVVGKAVVAVTGVEGTGEVDSVTVIGDANVAVTGLEATGNVGSVTVIEGEGVSILVSSPRILGKVGIVTVVPEINVFVTGVAATGQVGQLNTTIWNEITPTQSTTWTEIAA